MLDVQIINSHAACPANRDEFLASSQLTSTTTQTIWRMPKHRSCRTRHYGRRRRTERQKQRVRPQRAYLARKTTISSQLIGRSTHKEIENGDIDSACTTYGILPSRPRHVRHGYLTTSGTSGSYGKSSSLGMSLRVSACPGRIALLLIGFFTGAVAATVTPSRHAAARYAPVSARYAPVAARCGHVAPRLIAP
eukprot:1930036-Rhodomonas_salina.1